MSNATAKQATHFAGVFVQHHQLLTAANKNDLDWAIRNGGEAVSLFVSALKNRAGEIVAGVKKTLTPFVTIRTGGTDEDQLLEDIRSCCNKDHAPDNLADFVFTHMMANSGVSISKKAGTADLVMLSVRELGFIAQPRTDEFMTAKFCTRWSSKNLDGYTIKLCHPEDGPQLLMQWLPQQNDSEFSIAMEAINNPNRSPSIFNVGCRSDGKRWLHTLWAASERKWDLDSRFVFRLCKIV